MPGPGSWMRLEPTAHDFRDKMRSSWRALGTADLTREERRAQFATMRDEYQQTLYSLVPAAEADTIVQGMSRYAARPERGPGRGGRGGGR